ncbi:MAG: ACT domain-containing protein [Oscillospiraceae bacterium]|nr:ACT domain-containing protein [Oscillospiraceae bacterium]
MKAIVTVIGKDQVGIIAAVCNALSLRQINVLDISQTVLQAYFTMIMLADLSACETSFADLSEQLKEVGTGLGMDIRIQREDIFNAMHRI